jgi:hypothetical protein
MFAFGVAMFAFGTSPMFAFEVAMFAFGVAMFAFCASAMFAGAAGALVMGT